MWSFSTYLIQCKAIIFFTAFACFIVKQFYLFQWLQSRFLYRKTIKFTICVFLFICKLISQGCDLFIIKLIRFSLENGYDQYKSNLCFKETWNFGIQKRSDTTWFTATAITSASKWKVITASIKTVPMATEVDIPTSTFLELT